jgi:hypothetical protein
MNEDLINDIVDLCKWMTSSLVPQDGGRYWQAARILEAMNEPQLTTPEPAGEMETVRVRAGVYWDAKHEEWWVRGTQGQEPPANSAGDDRHFFADIDLPAQPRIPTVAARVVEATE